MARPRVLHDAATLSTRLVAVEEDVRDLKRTFEAGFATIHAKLDERAKVPWPAWSLLLAGILSIGAFAYWPIREKQLDLRSELETRFTVVRQDVQDTLKDLIGRDRRIWDMLIETRIKVEREMAVQEYIRGRNRD